MVIWHWIYSKGHISVRLFSFTAREEPKTEVAQFLWTKKNKKNNNKKTTIVHSGLSSINFMFI